MTKNIPALDGLRGIAILMVLLFHFNDEAILKKYLPDLGPIITKITLYGFTGVDLFFVLSGFLITGILLEAKGHKNFFKNFYARRILRIFPAYYGALVLVFYILPYFIEFDASALEISSNQYWLWTYLSNLPFVQIDWDGSNNFYLAHFWSLAVEQHFYILWPFIVYIISNRTFLKKVCILWFFVSSIIGVIDVIIDKQHFFLGWSTITRSGGLALGSYCALIIEEKKEILEISKKVLIFTLPFIFILILIPRRISQDFVESLLLPISWVMFSSLLIYITKSSQQSFLNKFFSNIFLRKLGLYSYGVYIFHAIFAPWFEKIFPREYLIEISGFPIIGICLYFFLSTGTSYLIAFTSWHVIEKHFLKLKSYFR